MSKHDDDDNDDGRSGCNQVIFVQRFVPCSKNEMNPISPEITTQGEGGKSTLSCGLGLGRRGKFDPNFTDHISDKENKACLPTSSFVTHGSLTGQN